METILSQHGAKLTLVKLNKLILSFFLLFCCFSCQNRKAIFFANELSEIHLKKIDVKNISYDYDKPCYFFKLDTDKDFFWVILEEDLFKRNSSISLDRFNDYKDFLLFVSLIRKVNTDSIKVHACQYVSNSQVILGFLNDDGIANKSIEYKRDSTEWKVIYDTIH